MTVLLISILTAGIVPATVDIPVELYSTTKMGHDSLVCGALDGTK